jgi:hypothetical protein
MRWEDVVTLLTVYNQTAGNEKLRDLHNRAAAELAAIDVNDLHFVSQENQEEGLDE